MLTETIDFADVVALKVMGGIALCAVLLAPVVLVLVAFAWLLTKLPASWLEYHAPPRPMTERERFIASLPKTKAGNLWPAGKRQLEQFDRSMT